MSADRDRITALAGRVTTTLKSLAVATMLVKKYCSAIGPRMTPCDDRLQEIRGAEAKMPNRAIGLASA